MHRGGCVYILSSKGRRLYTGVTARLQVRVAQHKVKKNPNSFTARYNIDRLVYYEVFGTIGEAIARESAIKNMHRIDKIALIVGMNPDWKDLSEDWGKPIKPFDEKDLAAHYFSEKRGYLAPEWDDLAEPLTIPFAVILEPQAPESPYCLCNCAAGTSNRLPCGTEAAANTEILSFAQNDG
jgi:putative endonuclease